MIGAFHEYWFKDEGWSANDARQAAAEGWRIAPTYDTVDETVTFLIAPLEPATRPLVSLPHVLRHVSRAARLGSELHQREIQFQQASLINGAPRRGKKGK